MKEFFFALFLILEKYNQYESWLQILFWPNGIEGLGKGGEAEDDWEHPPVDQDFPVRASHPSQAQDQGRHDVDSLEKKLNN